MVAGPSGVGKGTVVRRVRELVPDLQLSVSVTTRAPRPSLHEREGVDYVFVSEPEFRRMIEQGELLEWAELFGSRYGTPRAPVEQRLAAGQDVVLEIDVQGARQVREVMPEAVLIFLRPPSLQELERRLRSRGTEDEAKLRERLAKAEWEQDQAEWFDHSVENDDVERATSQVAAIIETSRGSSGRSTDGATSDAATSDGATSEGHPDP